MQHAYTCYIYCCMHINACRCTCMQQVNVALTSVGTKQGIPAQQLQSHKGCHDSWHTQTHVGVCICPRLLLFPLLQPVLDSWQAAILLAGVCKDAVGCFQGLCSFAAVVIQFRIAFVCCGISPALLCCILCRQVTTCQLGWRL